MAALVPDKNFEDRCFLSSLLGDGSKIRKCYGCLGNTISANYDVNVSQIVYGVS